MTLCPGRRDRFSVAGEWDRDLSADLDVIAAWKPDLMLTLVEEREYARLGVATFAEAVKRRVSNWRHLPIVDAGVPDETFEQVWLSVGAEARDILKRGGNVLVHCRAGLGRTGMIAARLLVELGVSPDDAIAQVRKARPNTIETHDQERHVRAQTRRDYDPIEDRLYGTMLGAAIGDALGSAFEFVSSAGIYDRIGSAVAREFFEAVPGSLMSPRRRGIPTDDTAMTLALVDALTADESPSPHSIQRAFGEGLQRRTGAYGDMFWNGGPGGACIAMLRVFDDGAAPFERLDADAGGNGAAMRAHPCGAFARRAFVAELAAQQARISHPHSSAVAAAQVVALIVHDGIYTGRLARELPPEINDAQMIRAWDAAHRNLARGEQLPKHLRDVDMAGWNTVAAAHAIAQMYADDIETGIGIAAASGGDTDTVASIVGAMLGAVHGRRSLPKRWIDGLEHRDVVESAARALYHHVVVRERTRPAQTEPASRVNGNTGRAPASTGALSSALDTGLHGHQQSSSQPLAERAVLTSRFHRALMDAEFYHHEQTRKSTNVPYFSHLLGVCSLVLEAGGSETEAIAALLHDAPEDAGGAPVLAAIERNFGADVASIVEHLSDALPEHGVEKADWKRRKSDYIDQLGNADRSTLLVGAADKLHNLRAIQSDYQQIGNAVFERFSAPDDKRANTLWYYRSLLDVYDRRDNRDRDPRLERLTGAMRNILESFDVREERNAPRMTHK